MAAKELADLLGTPPPASIAALPAEARDNLAALVAEARRNQAVGLQEAFQKALRHVPFPVRGVVKKVLLG